MKLMIVLMSDIQQVQPQMQYMKVRNVFDGLCDLACYGKVIVLLWYLLAINYIPRSFE